MGVLSSFISNLNPDGSDGIWMTSFHGLIPNCGTPEKIIRGIIQSGNCDSEHTRNRKRIIEH
ncbi:MAG: hypothetical protein GC181_07700 [Bacteroidetes bacterium]|nr:hypothetical protein [Bacteroidota bacterium]